MCEILTIARPFTLPSPPPSPFVGHSALKRRQNGFFKTVYIIAYIYDDYILISIR